jgi:hypothetical protein
MIGVTQMIAVTINQDYSCYDKRGYGQGSIVPCGLLSNMRFLQLLNIFLLSWTHTSLRTQCILLSYEDVRLNQQLIRITVVMTKGAMARVDRALWFHQENLDLVFGVF